MKASERIRQRLKEKDIRFHSNDNIADFGAELNFKEPLKIMAMYHSTKSTSMGFQYNRNNRWQFYGYYTTPTRELVGLNAGAFELGIQLRTGK